MNEGIDITAPLTNSTEAVAFPSRWSIDRPLGSRAGAGGVQERRSGWSVSGGTGASQ